MLVVSWVFLSAVWASVESAGVRKALPHEFPWACSIQREHGVHLFGGSVITENFVLTVCSPLRFSPVVYQIVAGSVNLTPGKNKDKWTGQIRKSALVYYHPNCTRVNIGVMELEYVGWKNNMAAIGTNKPFTFNRFLQRMALGFPTIPKTYKDMEDFLLSQQCVIIGWGYLHISPSDDRPSENYLMIVNVTFINDERYDFYARNEYCFLHPPSLGDYEFPGDLGSSVFCQRDGYGLVSYRFLRSTAFPWKPKWAWYREASKEYPTIVYNMHIGYDWLVAVVPEILGINTSKPKDGYEDSEDEYSDYYSHSTKVIFSNPGRQLLISLYFVFGSAEILL